MSDVKKKVEAVLFSSGSKLTAIELSKLCRAKSTDVLQSLEELKKEYDEKQSSLMIINEGEHWKFSIREQFLSVVRKVVAETELTKSVLETLAVIAFKYPILQSDLIKIRTNKAYEHLSELEKSGYISRKKKSRTNLILLTGKFFEYFDLAPDKLKEKFRDFDSIARAIEGKEGEVRRIKEDQKKAAEEAGQQDEKIRREIEHLDKTGEEYKVPLAVYRAVKDKEGMKSEFVEKGNLIEEKEKLGEMEVVSEEPAEDEAEEAAQEESGEPGEEREGKNAENKQPQEKKEEKEEMSEEDEAVQREIDKMIHPQKEKEEEK